MTARTDLSPETFTAEEQRANSATDWEATSTEGDTRASHAHTGRSQKSGPQLSPTDRGIYRELGQRLRTLRTYAGMSVTACALHARVSRHTLETFEAGETVPSPATMSVLFRVFHQRVWIKVGPVADRSDGERRDF